MLDFTLLSSSNKGIISDLWLLLWSVVVVPVLSKFLENVQIRDHCIFVIQECLVFFYNIKLDMT